VIKLIRWPASHGRMVMILILGYRKSLLIRQSIGGTRRIPVPWFVCCVIGKSCKDVDLVFLAHI